MKKFTIALFFILIHIFTIAQIKDNILLQKVKNSAIDGEFGVNDFVIDVQGFMWIATDEGLYRYNGNVLKVYNTNSSKKQNSIPSNKVLDVLLDKQNNLWIATQSGIAKYNSNLDNFMLFSEQLQDLQIDNIYTHTIQLDNSGNIWFTTPKALCVLDPNSNTIKTIFVPKTPSTIDEPFIHTMCVATNGVVWLGLDKLLYKYDPYIDKFTHIPSYNENADFISAIKEDYNQTIWIGTVLGKIMRYFPKNNFLEQKEFPNQETKKESTISDFFIDIDSSVIAMVQQQGLFRIKNSQITKKIPSPFFDNVDNREITNIVKDINNNYWFSHAKLGMYCSKNISDIQHISSSDNAQMLKSSNISSIFIDTKNNIWLGTDGAGLYVKESGTNSFKAVSLQSKTNEASIMWIGSLKPNTVCVGTYKKGIFEYDIQNKIAKTLFSNVPHLSSRDVRKVIQDKKGAYWILTHGAGMISLINNKTIYYTASAKPPLQLAGDWTYDILCLPDNKIVVATNYGISIIDPSRTHIQNIRKNVNYVECLSHNTVNALWYDGVSKIWCGTKEGISIYDIKSNTFTKSILQNYSISSIISDKAGNLWITTLQGIINYNPKTHSQLYNLTADHGLHGSRFNANSLSFDSKGYLYAGGIHGLNIINTNSFVKKYKKSNKIFCSDIFVNNSHLYTILPNNVFRIGVDSVLSLDYLYNNLEIEFTTFDLINEKKYLYSYKIEGLDTCWRTTTASKVLLNNLAPGNYILYVKVNSSFSNHNKETLKLYITILSPWWKTWWALAIAIAILLSVSWAIYIYLYRRRLEGAKLKAERNEEIQKMLSKEIIQNNRKITDSLTYAKNIQKTILPNRTHIGIHFPHHFVYYMPKEIVSGDFYWLSQQDDYVFFALVDCTGHGIPGAFMSMVGNTLLNQIVNEAKVIEPAKILQKLDSEVIAIMRQNNENSEQEDGMEVALLRFNRKTRELIFAGAGLKIIVSNKQETQVVRGNKFGVGGMFQIKNEYNEAGFTQQVIPIEFGTRVYLYTDGVIDQFNDANNERFLTKRLVRAVKELQDCSISEQRGQFIEILSAWRGKQPQTDDTSLIGLEF